MTKQGIKNHSTKISFVLVHLGKKPIPAYLWDCIRQIRRFNDNKIYLVANIYNIGINFKLLKENNVSLILAESLKAVQEHRMYRKETENKWFWKYTTERFYYIYELMCQKKLENVIHIENDNLIYRCVDDYYEQFQQLNDARLLGVTRDSNRRCIGGLIYIPNKEALFDYIKYITANPQLNDMESLAQYFQDKHCEYLPVVYPEYLEDNELVNQQGEHLKEEYNIVEKSHDFGAIFDAAALGQYIGGIDKIHDQADTRGFINETACYNPSKMHCEWLIKNGNKIPVIKGAGYEYPVFNLHIHSKELSQYMSFVE